MGKITLLVRICLIIFLFFASSNTLLAYENSDLEDFNSTSEGICYMFFESKEIKPLDFSNSVIESFTESHYKKETVKSFIDFTKPTVNLGSNPTITVCQGVRSANLAYTAATQSANKYTITYDPTAKAQGFLDVPKTDFAGGASGNFPIVIPANPAPGTYNVNLKVHNTNSTDADSDNIPFKIIINGIPTLNQPADQTVCNNLNTTTVNFSGNNLGGVVYNWTNNRTSIGLAASGSGIIPPFKALNTTNSSVVATITVTPTANGCAGTPKVFKINVDPTTSFNKPSDVVACNSETISAINFAGASVSGTTYSWTNNNTAIGIAASGNGNIASFIATNTSNAPIIATITVTPTANNCAGTPQTFQITVNPTTTFTRPSDVVVCNSETISAINFAGASVPGTTFTWTNNNTSIGLAASGNGNISSFNATNTTNAPISATVTVTPTANDCVGTPQTFEIIVNPTTIFTKPSDVVVCNSETISAINFAGASVPGTIFTWTNNNTSIGLAASGIGNISSFNATNTTNAPISATVTVTPTANNCVGTPQTFQITVNPTTTFTKPSDVVACNAQSISAINFAGATVTGTTYSWTNSNTAIGLAASGIGNISSFNATNTTNAQIVAEILVTPTANNCEGEAQLFTIKVNPSIEVELALTPVSCNGEKNGIIQITSATGGNGNLQFSLDNINFDTNTEIKNLYADIYTLYVKDAEICTYEIEVEITEPLELAITPPTSTDETCFGGITGGHDGTITAGIASGGNGEYLYSLDNATFQSSPDFSNLAADNYTVFVKDSKGCATQSNITVGSLAEMKADLTKTDIKCFDEQTGIIQINNPTGGSGSYEYQIIDINNPTGIEAWTSNSEIPNLISSDYKVNIRDTNRPDCIVEINSAYTLTQPNAALTASVTATRTLNYGSPTGSATVTAEGGSGGYTYVWRVAGQLEELQFTKTASSLSAGDYEVTVFDSNGCSTVQNITVVDIILASISDTSRCLQNTDNIRTSSFQVDPDLTVGGIGNPYNFKYEWNFGAQAVPSTAEGLDRHVVEYRTKGDKIITLTVTETLPNGEQVVSTQTLDHYVGGCFEGCRSVNSSQDFQIDENNYFIGDANGDPITNENCDNSGVRYLWIDITKSSNVYALDVELIYSTNNGLLTDSGQLTGCFGTKDQNSNKDEWEIIPIGLYPLFQVDSAESNTNIEYECGEGFSIDQMRIRWTTNSRKECGDATGNSCIDSSSIIPVSVPIYATVDFTDTPCNGTALGSLTIRANGGVKPFAYSMNGDLSSEYVTTKEFYNLPAGNYTNIWVKDSKGTTYQVPLVTISEPDVLSIESVEEDEPILCYDGVTSATVTVIGGTPPYSYLWNDEEGQTTATTQKNLVAGSYTVTVTDAKDCQTIETIVITEPIELSTPNAGEDQSFKCGVVSTILNANIPEVGEGKWIIKSGTGGMLVDENYALTAFKGLANSTYTLDWTISNPDGTCLKTDELTIIFSDDCSALDFDGIDDHVNFGNNHNLQTNTFTFEVWVKPNSINGARTVFSKRDASNLGSGGYDLIINNGAPTFRRGNISISTSTKLTTNRWYHLAVTFEVNKYILYVDGLDVGTKTGVTPVTIESPFLIGAMHNNSTPENPSNYFEGWIEELRIWNEALNEDQLHFLMNQRLAVGSFPLKGNILPTEVPGDLSWENLTGYYQLIAGDVSGGITLDETLNAINGSLKNIESNQENTAPLPYKSAQIGDWYDRNTWLKPDVWDSPNSTGINDEKIDWNIVETSHDIASNYQNIKLLGLNSISGTIEMEGVNPNPSGNGDGNALTVTHYLKLDGIIDLNGESQLVQIDGSILDNSSSGFIEKDQQGTASSYNYNYWSSPVVPQANTLNSTYTVASVLLDGTNASNPKIIDFGQGVTYADGAAANPRKISNYWIYKFRGKADEYSDYEHIGSTGVLNVGEGYTMKGTSGSAEIIDRQNYVFRGKPNNGDIKLNVGKDQNYMLGNPYPSAIDATKFILDNINASGGTNQKNVFNGALYFWDHFGGKTHTLREYVGGYATYNLIGGVKAIATDDRINSNTGAQTSNENVPGQYIPVGQGFFINTVLDDEVGDITVDGGEIIFKNSQRAFKKENTPASHFLRPEQPRTKGSKEDSKIRLDFKSPLGYQRQILVGTNEYATNGFDLGYDAPLNDYNEEDFFWLINNIEYVIQGVSNFDPDQVLPIGVYITKAGEAKFEINKLENVPSNTKIYLKDLETKLYHDLRESEFKIELEPGAYYERFQIVFEKRDDDSEEAEEEEEEEEEEVNDEEAEEDLGPDEEEDTIDPEDGLDPDTNLDLLYMSTNRELAIINPDNITIQKVIIYNLLGQKIQEYEDLETKKIMRLGVKEFPMAVYLVKMYSEKGEVSKNIMLMR